MPFGALCCMCHSPTLAFGLVSVGLVAVGGSREGLGIDDPLHFRFAAAGTDSIRDAVTDVKHRVADTKVKARDLNEAFVSYQESLQGLQRQFDGLSEEQGKLHVNLMQHFADVDTDRINAFKNTDRQGSALDSLLQISAMDRKGPGKFSGAADSTQLIRDAVGKVRKQVQETRTRATQVNADFDHYQQAIKDLQIQLVDFSRKQQQYHNAMLKHFEDAELSRVDPFKHYISKLEQGGNDSSEQRPNRAPSMLMEVAAPEPANKESSSRFVAASESTGKIKTATDEVRAKTYEAKTKADEVNKDLSHYQDTINGLKENLDEASNESAFYRTSVMRHFTNTDTLRMQPFDESQSTQHGTANRANSSLFEVVHLAADTNSSRFATSVASVDKINDAVQQVNLQTKESRQTAKHVNTELGYYQQSAEDLKAQLEELTHKQEQYRHVTTEYFANADPLRMVAFKQLGSAQEERRDQPDVRKKAMPSAA